MKKQVLSLLLMLSLLFSLGAAVLAEDAAFVFDDAALLSGEQTEIINGLGAQILADTGVRVCACLSGDTGEDIRAFAADSYDRRVGAPEGMLLVYDPSSGSYSYYLCGDRLSGLGEEELTKLFDAFLGAPTYFDGVYNYMNLVSAYLSGASSTGEVSAGDNPNIPDERLLDRVADLAGVVDASRLAALNALADEVSETYQCDVAVAFVQSLEGRYIVSYADDFYDYKGYGYGPDDDGILLLVSVGDREFGETTYGYGKTAFTDYGMQHYLEPRFTPFLGENDWAGAAEQFIRDAGVLLKQAREGRPYDYYGSERVVEKKSFRDIAPGAAVISAIIGFFSGGIPAGAMKRKMKSVEKNYGAANYARGGLNLRRSDDRFLYANVSKTPIPRETEHRSSGGGSSVHFSSSGRSHGGSHGKF